MKKELIEFAVKTYLPENMYSPEAIIMLIAIGNQESGFKNRFQIGGPARGFWQFEIGGVNGVLGHPATAKIAAELCSEQNYDVSDAMSIQQAFENNDILACCFARMFLWTLPKPLPEIGNEEEAWEQYLSAWRPGKPSRDRWKDSYKIAVNG